MGNPVGPVVLRIEINGEVQQEYPLEWEMKQAWGRHDLFKLTLVIPRGHANMKSLVAWPDNSPVKLIWGRSPNNLNMWYGYINHHVLNTNSPQSDNATQITYTFIGTSKVMNADQTKRWESTTPSGIAQTLAKKYSLRAVTTYVDWPIKYEVQAGESDFEFLTRMAQKYGYRFWVSGGTLYFVDPAAILHGPNPNYVPQYFIDHYPGRKDTARDFKLYRGDAIPGGNMAVRQISGIDASNNSTFTEAADGPVQKNLIQQTQRHVTSRAEARRLMNAQQNLSQYWQAGNVQLFGYVLLYPNKMIKLDGYGIPNGYGGNWVVSGTHHKLTLGLSSDHTKDKFTSHVDVVKNTTTYIPKVSSYQTITPEIVQCTLVDGIWQANNRSALTSGVVAAG